MLAPLSLPESDVCQQQSEERVCCSLPAKNARLQHKIKTHPAKYVGIPSGTLIENSTRQSKPRDRPVPPDTNTYLPKPEHTLKISCTDIFLLESQLCVVCKCNIFR